jgi:hypothetical protein
VRLPVNDFARNEGMNITHKKWKIGEIAKLTGLTVRTLHHYDHIGLLMPSQYSETGHRLYIDKIFISCTKCVPLIAVTILFIASAANGIVPALLAIQNIVTVR